MIGIYVVAVVINHDTVTHAALNKNVSGPGKRYIITIGMFVNKNTMTDIK